MESNVIFATSLNDTIENSFYFDEVSQSLKKYENGKWKTKAYKHVIHNGYELIQYRDVEDDQ